MIWVWVNNPLTMLPMYYGFYVTGVWLMGTAGPARGYEAFGELWNRPEAWTERVALLAKAVGVATLIGSVPFAVTGSALSYGWAMAVVTRRRRQVRPRRTGDPAPGGRRG